MQMSGKEKCTKSCEENQETNRNQICFCVYLHLHHFHIQPCWVFYWSTYSASCLLHQPGVNLCVVMIREYDDIIHYIRNGSGEQVNGEFRYAVIMELDFTFHSNWIIYVASYLLNQTRWDRKVVSCLVFWCMLWRFNTEAIKIRLYLPIKARNLCVCVCVPQISLQIRIRLTWEFQHGCCLVQGCATSDLFGLQWYR